VLKATGNALPHDRIATQKLRTCASCVKTDYSIAPKRTPEGAEESGVRTKKLAANDPAERSVRRRFLPLERVPGQTAGSAFLLFVHPDQDTHCQPLAMHVRMPESSPHGTHVQPPQLVHRNDWGCQVALVFSSARSAVGRWQGYSDAVI